MYIPVKNHFRTKKILYPKKQSDNFQDKLSLKCGSATGACPEWPPGRVLGRKFPPGLVWSWCRMGRTGRSDCLPAWALPLTAEHSRPCWDCSPPLHPFSGESFWQWCGSSFKLSSGVQHPALMEQIRDCAVNAPLCADEVWSDRDRGKLCFPASLAYLLSLHHLLSIKRLVVLYFTHCDMKFLLL